MQFFGFAERVRQNIDVGYYNYKLDVKLNS